MNMPSSSAVPPPQGGAVGPAPTPGLVHPGAAAAQQRASSLSERLMKLSQAEHTIGVALKQAADCCNELTKEKMPSKNTIESHLKGYRDSVDQIEKNLSAQIDYLANVTVGVPHQSSTFTATQMKLLSEARLAAINETLHSMVNDSTYDTPGNVNGSNDETTPPPLAPAM